MSLVRWKGYPNLLLDLTIITVLPCSPWSNLNFLYCCLNFLSLWRWITDVSYFSGLKNNISMGCVIKIFSFYILYVLTCTLSYWRAHVKVLSVAFLFILSYRFYGTQRLFFPLDLASLDRSKYRLFLMYKDRFVNTDPAFRWKNSTYISRSKLTLEGLKKKCIIYQGSA